MKAIKTVSPTVVALLIINVSLCTLQSQEPEKSADKSVVINVSSSPFAELAARMKASGKEVPKDQPIEFGFGDQLILTVENLEALSSLAEDEKKPIVPYFDGIPIPGLAPLPYDPAEGELRFILHYDSDFADAWKPVLGGSFRTGHNFLPGRVSVGVETDYPLKVSIPPELERPLRFVILGGWRFFFAVLVSLGVVAALILLSRYSNLIRDSGPNPPDQARKPYSLARFQMAIFFALVISSFLFLFAVTGGFLPSIPDSVLILIGISAGTGLAVIVQDNQKPTQIDKIEAQLKDLDTETPAGQTKAGQIEDEIEKLKNAPAPTSEKFITDVLSDKTGISFHRFQIFCWTIVLAVIFVFKVMTDLAMPDFNATLLGLMGISSGTYVGFMIPEAHSSEQHPSA